MAKTRTVFVCSNCGSEAAKWTGRCPSCNQWNTFVEEIVIARNQQDTARRSAVSSVPMPLKEINPLTFPRLNTGIGELNRVLGGGLVKGSVVLIAGEPGIGKSTLALQVALSMNDHKILYVSGEESTDQIKLRADRIGRIHDQCFVLNEVSLEKILGHLSALKPEILIIDSVQTMEDDSLDSSPGSVSQIRDCTVKLMRFAKENATPVMLIGHITKDGAIAGPKILEHIVDTVLLFEGDQQYMFRMLRASKNRYGATTELGIFEMAHEGLKQVENPSGVLISRNHEGLSGIAAGVTVDGARPFLIEVQALVSTAAYGMPQRVSTGFDVRRLNMLLAVLERRAGFKLASRDVFLNLAGGLRISDPALDLAIMIAILSSSLDRPLGRKICFSAEVGLSGEVRPVGRIENRIKEAERIGFSEMMISGSHEKTGHLKESIRLLKVDRLEEAIRLLFGKNSDRSSNRHI